jgi:hypothetical protein
MRNTLLDMAHRLSDQDLISQLHRLARHERTATVELVAHLVELDTRRLHLPLGFGSLFAYCTEELHLAEHAAYNRIEAARAARRFPVILDRLGDGSLNLSTLRLLVPHLSAENHEAVMRQAAGMSKRGVEQLVAVLAPRADAPSWVRKLPTPRWAAPVTAVGSLPGAVVTEASAVVRGGSELADGQVVLPAAGGHVGPAEPGARTATPAPGLAPEESGTGAQSDSKLEQAPVAPGSPARDGGRRSQPEEGSGETSPTRALAWPLSAASIAPLSPERFRVQLTVTRETHDDLRRAQDLLRREIPDGDPARIFARALKLLIEDVARRKTGATSRSRPGRASPGGTRHVPAHVRRAVWLRDGGRCAFVASGGRRCGQRAFLEFHHLEPYAVGGETKVANLSLRCRAHNVHEHVLLFGSPPYPATRPGASRTQLASDPRTGRRSTPLERPRPVTPGTEPRSGA